MNAWQRLLAASSLAIGTAWELLTHPKTGGRGATYNTGMAVTLAPSTMSAEVSGSPLVATVASTPVNVTLAPTGPVAVVPSSSNVVVAITTAPITV